MILPIVFGVIVLGRGFDRQDLRSTYYYIYDQEDIAKKVEVTPNPSVESKYLVVTSNSEAQKFLGLDTEFAIKSKHGDVSFSGYSNFVEPVVDRENTVEILFSVKVDVEKRTFPSNTQLRMQWQKSSQKQVGTHFVKSLQYGGLYLGSYRLTAAKPEYFEDIRAAVEKYFGKSGQISDILSENIEKFEEEIGSKARISVQMHSAPPVDMFPYSTFTQLVEGAKKYPDVVRNQFKGKGNPLSMELVDLHTVEESFKEFKINTELKPVLEEVDAKYDDLRLAKKLYRTFDKHLIGPNGHEKLIADYEKHLYAAHKALSLAIAYMDVTGSKNQFDEAFETYGECKSNNKYTQELKEIIKTVEEGGHSDSPRKLMASFQKLLTELRSL